MEEMAFLLARQSEHPELGILKQPRRMYRYGFLASHVTGYVGEVSKGAARAAGVPESEGRRHCGSVWGRKKLQLSVDRGRWAPPGPW